MSTTADTVIDVRALIDRPGATMSLDRRVAVPADLGDELVRVGDQIKVTGLAERVVDGIIVRGTVAAPIRTACARCLTESDDEIRADVVELFAVSTADDLEAEPGYEIVDATIDIESLIRDAVAEAIPTRPLCRPDCAGLCPMCGADMNAAPCDGHEEPPDLRWAALSDLKLPESS